VQRFNRISEGHGAVMDGIGERFERRTGIKGVFAAHRPFGRVVLKI
jgi:hypothetical protein